MLSEMEYSQMYRSETFANSVSAALKYQGQRLVLYFD